MMRFIFGITGGSGAGKTTVSNILRQNGIYIIDGDVIAREVMEPGEACLKETVDFFGNEILNMDGTLNRKYLGDIVFNNSEKLIVLNKITHKHITNRVITIIEKSDYDIIGIDAAALFESGIDRFCDKVISVIADTNTRIDRIIKRDSISSEQAAARINSQKSNTFYIEKSDYLVYNEKNNVYEQVKEVLAKLVHEKEEKIRKGQEQA